MIEEIEHLFERLEDKKRELMKELALYPETQLRFQPSPDRWSMVMAVQHIVLGEQGLRLSEEELRHNPLRGRLQPGKLFETVLEILEKDVPVDVPHPSLEPENATDLQELVRLWDRERGLLRVLLESIPEEAPGGIMFSHPAAGPLDAARALRLAHAHFDTHRRQIDRLRSELEAG